MSGLTSLLLLYFKMDTRNSHLHRPLVADCRISQNQTTKKCVRRRKESRIHLMSRGFIEMKSNLEIQHFSVSDGNVFFSIKLLLVQYWQAAKCCLCKLT